MRYSSLVERIDNAGARAWAIHIAAIEAQRRGEDVILLSVGDPDFATPEPIVEASVAALRAGDTHYTEIAGRRPLRAAIAERFAPALAAPLGPENVILTAGAQNALFAASLCLLEPDDEVIVLEPMYVTYEATLAAAGARLVRVAMPAETGFRPDPEAIAAAVTPRTRAIVFATPNNPTGTVLARAELETIGRIARAHDLWVVVDEVYSALSFEAEHVSIAALPGMAARTVTIGSLSKSHAMTGWRVGWMIAPAELVSHVDRLALCMLYGMPGFVQEGAAAAFARYDAVTAEMRERYRRRRDLVCGRLADARGIRVLVPEAGMFVLLDVRATGLDAESFAWDLFRETGVSTLDANAFGEPARGFLRLAFTCAEPVLEEACRRILAFCERL